MTRPQEVAAAAIVVVASILALGTMARMSTGLVLPRQLFEVSTWWRAIKRTIIWTIAVTVGAAAAFGTNTAIATFVLGCAAIFLEGLFMSYARAFGPRR